MAEHTEKIQTKFKQDIEKYNNYYIDQIKKLQKEHERRLNLPLSECYDESKEELGEVEDTIDEYYECDDETSIPNQAYSAIVTILEPINYQLMDDFESICNSFRKSDYLNDKLNDIDLYICRYSLISLMEIKLLIDDIINKDSFIKRFIKHNTTTIYLSKIDDMVENETFKYTDGDYEILKNIYSSVDGDLWDIYRSQDFNKKIDLRKVLTLDEQMYFLSDFPIFINSSYRYTLGYTDYIFDKKCYSTVAHSTTYLRKKLINIKHEKYSETIDKDTLLKMLPNINLYISIIQECLDANSKKRVR